MFDSPVLGVDPGLAATGIALVERTPRGTRVVEAGTVRTPAGAPEPSRLRAIHEAVADAIRRHRPSAVALERLMWGRNAASAMVVARASGVVVLAAASAGVPVAEYAPLDVKMAVTGSGTASKQQVRRALVRVLAVTGVPEAPDAADAVAVAVCHAQRSRLTRLVAAT